MLSHFTSLDAITAQDLQDLLAVARYLKARRARGIRDLSLAGKSLAMIFEKPSLRTRLSFEVAMAELGGQALFIRGDDVGLGKREPIKDIARVISRYVQGIMLRVYAHATVRDMATYGTVPVINGLSDDSHPCQALADLLTISEHFGTTAGLRIVFIGDANNVARSLARACILAGSTLVMACPSAYAFGPADIQAFGSDWGTRVVQVHDPAAAVAGAHVLYTDVWTSMGQEAEHAERCRQFAGFRIDLALLERARPDCRIMHCLPAHRDEEISEEALEHPRSIILDQAENRMHAQKGILRLLLGADPGAVIAAAHASDRAARQAAAP